LGQLQKASPRLEELGYQIIAISPDPPEKVRALLEKTPYDYRLLSDTRLEAARALGVAYRVDAKTFERLKGHGIDMEHPLLPVPTVLVLDTTGTVRWVYANPNYKVRPDPDVVVSEAEKALGRGADPAQASSPSSAPASGR